MRRPNSLLCVVQYYGNALRPHRVSEASSPRLSVSRQGLGNASVRGGGPIGDSRVTQRAIGQSRGPRKDGGAYVAGDVGPCIL
ncbi:hypothetical protein BHE74_00013812 [Ensete ventricosum]|nr:hypothetical protein BHE74_00013812 [Ensete ventricosum]RZR90104.1 hypothetical protein BHM03_00017928 [Ensete ventricosum]